MSTPAWIDVERKEGLRDRARAYKVMIDGQQAGTIRHGSHESFRVTPGTHEVFPGSRRRGASRSNRSYPLVLCAVSGM